MVTDLKVKTDKLQNKEKKNVIKVESLKECDKKREYIEIISQNLEQLEGVGEIGGETRKLKRAAEKTLGKGWVGGTRKRHKRRWTEEVKEAIKRKAVLMRRWLKNRTKQTRAQYMEVRNETERVKRRVKEKAAKRELEEIMEDVRAKRKRIFRLTKTFRGSKRKVCNIKDKQGEFLVRSTDKQEINGILQRTVKCE